MILRVKDAQSSLQLLPGGDPQKDQAKEIAIQQWQTTLEQLSSNPPIGRVAIRISTNVSRWETTSADISVREGNTLVIPRKPSYVVVSGEVYNPTAISYRPGKSAKWYLSQSGGPTQLANKKAIFVIRADGSVIANNATLWAGNRLREHFSPATRLLCRRKRWAALSNGRTSSWRPRRQHRLPLRSWSESAISEM